MPTRFFLGTGWRSACKGSSSHPKIRSSERQTLFLSTGYIFGRLSSGDPQLLRPPTPQHLGLMQAQVFSPIMPQSLFRASWSPASFDVRQAWTRADLQLTNNADLPQKHPCGATSSWQSNAPSTVPPVPPKKPRVWQEGLTMNTCALYSFVIQGSCTGLALCL